MKNAISIPLLAVFVCSCFVTALASQGSDQPKAKGDSKNPNISASASLSANSSPEGQPRTTPASSSDTAADPNAEAQRRYDSAMALSEAGKLDEAIVAFKQSLKLRPEDAQTNFSLGMTYSKSKAYKDAFDSFKRAVRFKPDWAEAHYRLGVMSYVLGKRNQSLDEYKKLQQLNSPFANVLYRIIREENGPADVSGTIATGDSVSNSEPAVTKPTGDAPVSNDATRSSATPETSSQQLTEIYRVGVGDVLDVRFLNSATSRSTLFTVINGGVIDLPVAGGSIAVAGLTADEIQARIASELKRRAVDEKAQLSVGVRQYASHSVVVTGLVVNPGTRFLRREAVPLYVVLAESQLRNDAGKIVIMRAGTAGQSLDLSDPKAMNVAVQSGDVINVSGRPQEFYYIAGRINYPGQKNFQPGITLLQAILAAGGTTRQNENIVEISREGSGGRLVTTRFNIKLIKAGTVEDPKLQPGDRIEVVR
jgi:protein involved in polysaccharide export with SLBB domain